MLIIEYVKTKNLEKEFSKPEEYYGSIDTCLAEEIDLAKGGIHPKQGSTTQNKAHTLLKREKDYAVIKPKLPVALQREKMQKKVMSDLA